VLGALLTGGLARVQWAYYKKHMSHIPHIEFVNRPEFPPHGGGRRQVLAT
jgi:hypothetical protein